MCCSEAIGSFWVLDGHGGDGAAKFCSPKLGQEFAKSQYADDDTIYEGFHRIDCDFREHVAQNPGQSSGSTVVGIVAQRCQDSSYVVKLANAGDSRGLIVRGPEASESAARLEVRLPRHLAELGSSSFACSAGSSHHDFMEANSKNGHPRFSCRWPVIAESVDHKPDHPTEKDRITAANGYVTEHENPPRLDGNLAVSRALGDFEYKSDPERQPSEQKVSAVPDIYEVCNVPGGSFVVLACDGLWDVMSSETVARFVRDELAKDATCDLGQIAAHLVQRSLIELDTKDNVTVMIIQFANGSYWNSVPDEMKGWEKLISQGELDEDIRRAYRKFLSNCNFPLDPKPCAECNRWVAAMSQCPCEQVSYCSRSCQKKGWSKDHKTQCTWKRQQQEQQ